jgi:SNF2 family DNA or RNA helicase
MAGRGMPYGIDELQLPARTRNALVRAGVTSLERLASLSDGELLALRGVGVTAVAQVREYLAAWEQQHAPEEEPAQAAEVDAQGVYEGDRFELLPGRRVLHAAWLAEGRLFVWGEGEPPDTPDPQNGPPHHHPFQLSLSSLRKILNEPASQTAEPLLVHMSLPTVAGQPQPSPQLIRDVLCEKLGPPDSLGLWTVEGLTLPPLAALSFLNDLPRPEELSPRLALGADLGIWALASKLALEFLTRQQFAPSLVQNDGITKAVWVPVLDRAEDLRRVERLGESMPAVSRAVQNGTVAPTTSAPRALIMDFLSSVTDAAVREWAPPLLRVVTIREDATLRAWLAALFSENRAVGAPVKELASLQLEVTHWLERLLAGAEEPFRVCFRLEAPVPPAATATMGETALDLWTLRFFLQARDDPSLLVPASAVWRERGSTLRYLDRRFESPQEKLLTGLAEAGRLFAPLEASLRTARPELCRLSTGEAYAFLREAAALLDQSGFGVLVPQWWRQRHKSLGVSVTVSPAESRGVLNLDTLVHFQWRIALGEQTIAPDEFFQLAELKQPLVRVRGEWAELQPEQTETVIRFWEKRAAQEELSLRQALQIGLAEEGEVAGLPVVGLEAQGWVQELLDRLHGSDPLQELAPPETLRGQLRPYQVRGFSWLDFLRQWGLGACLADDMGLGKTVQTIAFILHDLETSRKGTPVLVVCPTSVVGNWAREIARFAPTLRVLVHHGSDRASGADFVARVRQADVVISTYNLARRDEESLRRLHWGGIVLDEAQNIKNPAAKQTQAIRRLRAGYRFALTGTPIENRLSELWSIMHFLNPGFLGSYQSFRTRFALPIERYQDRGSAERLRKLVQPFILRRIKTDPTIIQDLPEKLENKIYCTLTPEQATLYQAVVEEAMRQIETADGMQRRGQVLSMLLRLKQVCNHPAHFLGDGSPMEDRSGKLNRLGEMLEEVLAVGERALVFTQFAEMGTLLQAHLQDLFGGQVLFLYGGTPAKQRERMVTRFQEERHGPAIFILSLKAGGLGLNLTRANHVFHFDRWWNPAVENQATDRAFRIGQTRDVWVHKFICAGTLEERIDQLIESKKELAESVIGTGESWLTELNTAELRQLVTLSQEAIGD